jgi:hypothetical protein
METKRPQHRRQITVDSAAIALVHIGALVVPLGLKLSKHGVKLYGAVFLVLCASAISATLYARFRQKASVWPWVIGPSIVGLPLGLLLVAVSWALDTNPSGRAANPPSFLPWLWSLPWYGRVMHSLFALVPTALLVCLPTIGYGLGALWRRLAMQLVNRRRLRLTG